MRLLIVSNRLPFTVTEKDGKIIFKDSSGGLVSGLSAYLDSLRNVKFTNTEYLWVGWPGGTIDESLKDTLKTEGYSKYKAYPLFLAEEEMEKFYLGFCNKTIWPIFHYFPSYAVYNEEYWQQYKNTNQTFCEAISEIIKPDDIVWIHDYHLMLLPELLRKKFPELSIGFFLHIPFPSFELFRLLPMKWRREILEGLLGADLVGFHIQEYCQYFLHCVLRILGYDHNLGIIILQDRIIKADTFPMGIDFQKYNKMAGAFETKYESYDYKEKTKNSRSIISIDRLDYSKGIMNRLLGFETFLKNNPVWYKKIVLIVILVPSRIGVDKYQEMKGNIDEAVGRINGRFASIDWTPIIYQTKYLSFEELSVLYSIGDILLVTPLRDGMNLVAKEYIASRTDKTGVLIISEMAGACKELNEAIIINPNNPIEITEAIKDALDMPIEEQKRRNEIMQERLRNYDVIKWANDFIGTLNNVRKEQEKLKVKFINEQIKIKILSEYKVAQKRLILLDYDGTLVPFYKYPSLAKPDNILLNILKNLSGDTKTDLILISGRDKNILNEWFGKINICMVAEHGIWIKAKSGNFELFKPVLNDWKIQILPIMKLYSDRVPGTFIEEKEYSVSWHYRNADPELSVIRSRELTDDLVNFTANKDIQIIQGNKIVEVRNSGINKGTASLYFLSKEKYDMILALGDDATDEDMFKSLPETAYTIKVGIGKSNAKYNIKNNSEAIKLLSLLIKTINN